jgi:hypothetical protein
MTVLQRTADLACVTSAALFLGAGTHVTGQAGLSPNCHTGSPPGKPGNTTRRFPVRLARIRRHF